MNKQEGILKNQLTISYKIVKSIQRKFILYVMSIFQVYRINLSISKDYFNSLFADSILLQNEAQLNSTRTKMISSVFNNEKIEFGKNNQFIYTKKGTIGNFIYGIITKLSHKKNRFEYDKPKEIIPSYENTLIFINTDNADNKNWQKIFIMENKDFKNNLSDLLISLWQKSNIKNEIFDLHIRPCLQDYTGNFFSYFKNQTEKHIKKITEVKLHYDIANGGTGSWFKSSMRSLGATEQDITFKNQNGLKLDETKEAIIKECIEPIGDGVNQKAIIKGFKMNSTKTEILHDSSKNEKIETISTNEIEIDSIIVNKNNNDSLVSILTPIIETFKK